MDNMNEGNIDTATDGPSETEKQPLYDEKKAPDERISGNENLNGDQSEVNADEKNDGNQIPDGGWGWWCVVGCAITHFVTGGMERSGGVLLVELQEKFSQSAGVSAWVVSLSATFRLLFGPIASVLSNKFSCRTVVVVGGVLCFLGVLVSGFAPNIIFLYFSYGLTCGLGKSFAYAPGLVIVGHYFKKRRGMAVGVATAGGGLGMLALPPVIQILFDEFRFQGAFMLLSGLALHICIAGSLYIPLEKYVRLRRFQTAKSGSENIPLTQISNKKNRNNAHLQDNQKPLIPMNENEDVQNFTEHQKSKDKNKKGKNKLLDLNLLRNPIYTTLCIAVLFLAVAFNSVLVFIPPLAISIGMSKLEGALVLSMAGICDSISRFVSGVTLDLERVKKFRMIIYNGALFSLAILAFCLTFVKSFSDLLIIAALYGLFIGTYTSQKSVILADLLGTDALSSALGILICFQGIGTLLGPPITGVLRDITDSFNDGFYFSSGVTLLGALILTVGNIYQVYSNRKANRNTDTGGETRHSQA